MTIEMQREHQQQRPPQPDQRAGAANRQHAAQQRDAAAAVNTAVTVARVERTRARHLGADVRRLAEAFELLSQQINGRDDMAVLKPENVLRYGPGSPDVGMGSMPAVREFVARIMGGQLPDDALEDMHEARLEQHLAPAVRHADATYQRAHALENAAVLQPALPAGAVPPPSNGAELPRRVPGARGPQAQPIAPAQPPMFPPAPPETEAERTGALFSKLRTGGFDIPEELERAARKDGGSSLEMRTPDPSFAAAAIPQQRVLGDTARMPLEDVLEALAEGDESGPDTDGHQAPPPFPGASIADPGEGSSRSGGVGDDD